VERTRRLNVPALFIAPFCPLERSAQTSCTTCKPEAETRDPEACLITVLEFAFGSTLRDFSSPRLVAYECKLQNRYVANDKWGEVKSQEGVL
jgi:hypothetical protein